MIDREIMYEIVEKISEAVSLPITVCDVSGRIVVSNRPSSIGQMNLLAIEALNVCSKITNFHHNAFEGIGAAMPLMHNKSRIGALVIESEISSELNIIEILCKSMELLYAEKLIIKKELRDAQGRDQFLFEWLHHQSVYTEGFIKRGKHFKIDVTQEIVVIVLELNSKNIFAFNTIIQNLLDRYDALIPLDGNKSLVILNHDKNYTIKHQRLLKACHDCFMGISPPSSHLNTAYGLARSSLRLGKILFPQDITYPYEKMRLAIDLANIKDDSLHQDFALLIEKGKNACLAETVIAFLQYNGDIAAICDNLHIHRNSIQYRIKRIKTLCGKDLCCYYDLLYLYASFVAYSLRSVDSSSSIFSIRSTI